MRKPLYTLAAAALLSFGAQATDDIGLIDNQYIVQLQPGLVTDLAGTIDALLAGSTGARLLHQYDSVLYGFAVQMTPAQAAALALNPLVAEIEQDRVVLALSLIHI